MILPGFTAEYSENITGANGLVKAATAIQNSPDQGGHFVRFDYYGDVGTFKVDFPTSNVESLTFERSNSDSDGVIKVTGTLLDIKNMKAKVTLKGLAFQLMPNAVLLAGADGTKVNGSLLIDSCFIYADSLENTFLSWVGDNLSSVVISNSFIVVGGSRNATARISLSGGSLKLNNNLINFPGILSSPGVFKEAEFISNTINRTQFQLTGVLNAGNLPSLEFTKNLIAHKGSKDAFGGAVFYVVNYSNFNPARVFIQYNKMFKTWNGFDYPTGAKFNDVSSNIPIDTIPGIASTEKWNWYTETLDNNETGLLSGLAKIEKYNVMPPDSSYSWTLQRGNLKVDFRPALFPRQIRLDTNVAAGKPPSDSRFHRKVFPSTGAFRFGAFKVDKITLGAPPTFGYPVLLAHDSKDSAMAQPASDSKANPSVFLNTYGAGRKFILVNHGNTPQGENFQIKDSAVLKATDNLVIAKIDSAGETSVLGIAPGGGTLKPDLRSLGVAFRVTSSAVATSLFHIGAKEETRPYSADKVHWFFKNGSDTLVHADKPDTGSVAGRYTASMKYTTSKGDLSAYLVEKLSIPSGGTTIGISDGSITVASISGFQLNVDSNHVVDPESYGTPTKGYSIKWPLKSASDSIEITLKADSSKVMFVRLANGTISTVKDAKRIGGNLVYKLQDVDSGKVFFAAVEYNIQKNQLYNKITIDEVTVTGFRSSASGKLGFEGLSGEIQKSLGAAVKNYRFLGGIQMKAVSISLLKPDILYQLEFTPSKNSLDSTRVQAYFYNGEAWAIVPSHYLPAQNRYLIYEIPFAARAFALVERVEAPEKYVETDTGWAVNPQSGGKILTVSTSYIADSIAHITHYCVELQWVNESGSVESDLCKETDKKEIGQFASTPIDTNFAYLIRILYFMGEEEIKGGTFGLLRGTSFNVSAVAKRLDVKNKPKQMWHLVGFPVSGRFTKFMDPLFVPKQQTDSNKTMVMRFRKPNPVKNPESIFDTLANWDTLNVKPGDAFLLASSRPFETKVAAEDTALPLKPHKLLLDSGWTLIANPFSIRLVKSKITSSGLNDRLFYRLDTTMNDKGKRSYRWTPDSVLQPFFGYAYHAHQNETLTFNPLAGAAAKMGHGLAQAGDFEVRLEAPWGQSAMTLTASAERSTVPFLPVPGPGLQLRVGGGSGYMVKVISKVDQIDEPVEVRSPAGGRAAFAFNRPFRNGMTMRLIDLETGAVYDEASARSLPVSEGSHAYRLIAGDEAFVQTRIQAFKAAVPAEISMSQNYPNPFRGRTNVELRWPAWQDAPRTAVLDVIDMHGRLLQRVDLGEVRVGRQVVTLESKDWRTGVYLYRLTVATGGKRIRMQKRMLVTP